MPEVKEEITVSFIRNLVGEIPDPEIPVITISDLGILRSVEKKDSKFIITITPTYSGCPAMDMIGMTIHSKLKMQNIDNYKVITQLSPAWTTAWMTENGKKKLQQFGIAPPSENRGEHLDQIHPMCPHCHSLETELVSAFGSTACKALYRCRECGEPFDYFKCH